jgi:hypothetical protein
MLIEHKKEESVRGRHARAKGRMRAGWGLTARIFEGLCARHCHCVALSRSGYGGERILFRAIPVWKLY